MDNMRTKPASAVFLAFFGLTAALAGCSQQTLDSAQHDAKHNAAVVNQQARLAERETRPQVDKLEMQTRVTAALTAANLSPAVHVRADAEGVYLRGTVNTAADKARAGQIARDTLGPDKIVHNQLKISSD
jgi:osmotically-inducible protein OsmY